MGTPATKAGVEHSERDGPLQSPFFMGKIMENNSFFSMVVEFEGEPRTSSEVIAKGVGQQHASVLKLIRRFQSNLELFGGVRFEIRSFETKGGIQNREVIFLNERQATLLISFMRNSKIVVDFKMALVTEFYRMQSALTSVNQSLWQQMQALIAKEVNSQVRASFGSHLMLRRKREIPGLRDEREFLEDKIQPKLKFH